MSLTKNEIKFIKSLQQKKQRDLNKLFIVEGEKMVSELLQQSKFEVKNLLYTSEYDITQFKTNLPSQLISQKDLDRITGFKKANKVLAIVKQCDSNQINFKENNLILILDSINDPGNLGTIIRTADWFGITQIIANKETVELFNPKVIQSSMGAIYRVNYFNSNLEDIIKDLKLNNFKIGGALLNGKNIHQTKLPQKTALIMGSESHGLSEDLIQLLDLKLTIPQFGQTESLNVAIATSILLNEYKR